MKRFVALLGSPRPDGNSASISDNIMDTAKSLGAETQRFVLNELTFKGCQACMSCKTGSEKCVVEDDLARVLDAVTDADVLVLASPIYFGEITGQLKSALDRMYSFFKPDYRTNPNASRLAPGKKCVFVLTQGNPNGGECDVFPRYERILKRFGYESHVIRGLGLSPNSGAADRAKLTQQAEELAKELMS